MFVISGKLLHNNNKNNDDDVDDDVDDNYDVILSL